MSGEENKLSGKLRFKDQCYLLWNLATFIDNNFGETYENMAVVTGEPNEVMNKIVSKKDTQRLFNLTPAETSALVPMLRIFKTNFGSDDKTAELKFETVLSKDSVESIVSSRTGRGDGIGVKSMTYDLQGGSAVGGPSLVQGGVTQVDITFIFQNLEMLIQRSGNDQPALIDLVTLPATSKAKAPKCEEGSPIDLTNVFDMKKFGLKLVFGYANPHHKSEGVIDQELQDLIDYSRTTLKLSLARHELDFRQDGSVELKCQYQGYSEAIMGRPESDLFFVGDLERDPNIDGKSKDIDQVLEDLEKSKIEKEAAETLQDEKKIDANIARLEKRKESLEKELSEAEKKQGENDQVFMYKRLLQEIYDSGKVFFVDLSKEDVENHLREVEGVESDSIPVQEQPASTTVGDYYKGTSEEDLEKLRDELDANGPGFWESLLTLDISGNMGENNRTDAVAGNPQRSNPEDLKTEGWNDAADVFEETDLADVKGAVDDLAVANKSTRPKNAADTRINFIYYGDLLNIAFSILNKNKDADRVRPMLGPIAYTDPKSGQKVITNLADIPISLNKFIEWFNKSVVAKDKDSYLLKDFIKDTIKHLIHAALGERCFPGTNIPAPEPNVTIASVPLATENGKPVISMGTRTHASNVKVGGRIDYADDSKIDQYIYIYCYTFNQSNLDGDEASDFEKGIYHLKVGSDRGLVKKITFSRIDDPALAASRATSQKCNLRHLRENYKANISMIGNSLFKPGQTIYVDPTLAGGSDPQKSREVANALGLGGYYVVTKVGGEISRDGFVTDIEAIWESPKASDDAGIQPAPEDNSSETGEDNIEDIPIDIM